MRKMAVALKPRGPFGEEGVIVEGSEVASQLRCQRLSAAWNFEIVSAGRAVGSVGKDIDIASSQARNMCWKMPWIRMRFPNDDRLGFLRWVCFGRNNRAYTIPNETQECCFDRRAFHSVALEAFQSSSEEGR